MTLHSCLFSDSKELQACLMSDAAHVIPGARGEHVARLQSALVRLRVLDAADARAEAGHYGDCERGRESFLPKHEPWMWASLVITHFSQCHTALSQPHLSQPRPHHAPLSAEPRPARRPNTDSPRTRTYTQSGQ